MGRPPLALGTSGAIRCYRTDGGFRARALTRDYDGRVRTVERTGRTKTAAETALKLALRDRAQITARGHITAATRVSDLAEAWYDGLSELSPVTMEAYRRRLDGQILPGLGQLRVRELSVGVLDRHVRLIAANHGVATARMCRSVLSGMCTLAARHDALQSNPVRALGSLNAKPRKAPRALTLA
ncbi:MAG TPA: site-specific integrase, partial [Blastococcus sp.]|nr:site-specific integrase [Blastococcus sp.]